jgi:hypothetical protein
MKKRRREAQTRRPPLALDFSIQAHGFVWWLFVLVFGFSTGFFLILLSFYYLIFNI